jgi:hypothetical protein
MERFNVMHEKTTTNSQLVHAREQGILFKNSMLISEIIL